jgi:putative aminopeptidase FrvX
MRNLSRTAQPTQTLGCGAFALPPSLYSQRMPIPEGLRSLLSAASPPGQESGVAAVMRSLASDWSTAEADALGATIVRVPGATDDAPVVALVTHLDEIAVIVHRIDERGLLHFLPAGAWDASVLVGQRVDILTTGGGRLSGVVGRPPTALDETEAKSPPDVKRLHIDIGAKDGADAERVVRPGDMAVITAEPRELLNGRVVSRALDNRVGCYVALEAARRIAADEPLAAAIAVVGSTQEELVARRSAAGATLQRVTPDAAIVIDTVWETTQPGVDLTKTGDAEFGGGPVIVRGPQLHPVMSELLIEAALEEGIPHGLAASASATWTDADTVFLAGSGTPTGLVSLPIRYMHTPTEMVDLADVEACVRLIVASLERFDPSRSFER